VGSRASRVGLKQRPLSVVVKGFGAKSGSLLGRATAAASVLWEAVEAPCASRVGSKEEPSPVPVGGFRCIDGSEGRHVNSVAGRRAD
jgi:hypothetical protein